MDITPYALTASSTLPPGGSPAMDARYGRWLRDHVRRAQLEMLDRHWLDLPGADFLPIYQLERHLFKHFAGLKRIDTSIFTYNHRLRFMAIQFHHRAPEVVAESDRYAREQAVAYESEHYPREVPS